MQSLDAQNDIYRYTYDLEDEVEMVLEVLNNDKGNGLEIVSVDATASKYGSIRIDDDYKTLLYTWYTEDYGQDKIGYTIKDKHGQQVSARVVIAR